MDANNYYYCTNIVLYGEGGHSKVIQDILGRTGYSGRYRLVDDKYGPVNIKDLTSAPGTKFLVSIGDNLTRKKVVASIKAAGGEFLDYIVHPTIVLPDMLSYSIGKGTVAMAGVIVNSGSDIGEHVILNTGCSVDHDCVIDDFVHVAPGTTLCGHVEVGEGTLIGAGSVIIPRCKIGKNCVIAAGSVVVRDVLDDSMVMGNPAIVKKRFVNNRWVYV